jgi:subtilisin family serine protease
MSPQSGGERMIGPCDADSHSAEESAGSAGLVFDVAAMVAPLWIHSRGDAHVQIAILDGPVNRAAISLRQARLRTLELPNPTVRSDRASSHGTCMAGVILGESSQGAVGIAPQCSGLLIPVFDPDRASVDAPCSQSDLATAIDRARQEGAHVINVSGGAFIADRRADAALAGAVKACESDGVLIVAAVGNQGCCCAQVPAALPTVLAVGATDALGQVLQLSNWGDVYINHGLVAPGERIPADRGDGIIELGTGTSDAAAFTSGIAALLLSIQRQTRGDLDPLRIREILLQTARRTVFDDDRVFRGRLDPRRALARLLNEGRGSIQATASGASTLHWGSAGAARGPDVWQPSSAALTRVYQGVDAQRFGRTRILGPAGSSYLEL